MPTKTAGVEPAARGGAWRPGSAKIAVGILGATGAAPTLKALQDGGKLGKVRMATFDLSADVLTAIDQGNMLFAIDQQQYLQGYLPVLFLTLYKLLLLMPGGGQPVLTGPALVLKDTAAKIIDLTKRGVR